MKIKLFNVRGEEAVLAQQWADKNNIEIALTDRPLTVETLPELEGFDGIANAQVGPLDDKIYAQLKERGFKQIAQRSAGVDMYNLELARENGIIITNVPSYSPESIAEFTVAVSLNLIRKFELIRDNVKQHNFAWELPIRGRVLGDMTVAIIGTGHIGKAAARLFKGFGCKVLGYDLYPAADLDGILSYTSSITEAVQAADVISLHMPLTSDNYHLFDQKMFSKCKKGAILLNMARGGLVDTEALLAALDSGQLVAAGIDTYEKEGPYVPKNCSEQTIKDETFLKLMQHPQVIYTPHVAYYTDEAVKNLVEGGLNAVVEVLTTGTSKVRVN